MDTLFDRVVQLVSQGQEAVLVTVVKKEGAVPGAPGAKMLVMADGRTLGTVGGGEVEKEATAKALEVLRQRQPALVRYALMEGGAVGTDEALDALCGGRATLFFDYLGYAGHVYILGGGHVGQAVARHLEGLRLHVTVVDHRPEIGEAFQGANRVIIGNYAAALTEEAVPEGSFFLITTPSHAYDYECLRDIMASNWKPGYVGMLGSRPKAQAIIARLAEELGAEEVDWSVLYCPVGLDIGGSSPDEIAISIISEIQALRYGKAGHEHMRLARPRG